MVMKILKRTFIIIAIAIVLLQIGLFATGNMYVNKVLALTIFSGKSGPDIDELHLFSFNTIPNATPQPWPKSTQYNERPLSAETMGKMAEYRTTGFVVIYRDSVLHEQYWEGYSESSVTNSFSMAKSINALLIGIALKEGLIKSVDEPVANYIPEFREGDKSNITIKHLLTMSSGIDFKEEYASPFAWPAEAYYGPDVNKLTLGAQPKETPGKTWSYKGGDSQLLGMILKKATGKTVAEYAAEKLWQPIGAENDAYWSIDELGMEKVSCCYYASAKDFARIAKLYLQQGNWNGKQIVDSDYVAASLTAPNLTDIADGKKINKYGYQWWLMNYKNEPVFYMRGIRGQYVFCIPNSQLIIVRLGHKRAAKTGDDLPADIFTYLDAGIGMINH
jgi:CubicO group peptidase (beta-lactamase class C family)